MNCGKNQKKIVRGEQGKIFVKSSKNVWRNVEKNPKMWRSPLEVDIKANGLTRPVQAGIVINLGWPGPS